MNRWVKFLTPIIGVSATAPFVPVVKLQGRTWDEVFDDLAEIAFRQKDVLSANTWLESNSLVFHFPLIFAII